MSNISLNQIIIEGNLAADPRLDYADNSKKTPFCRFVVFTNESYFDRETKEVKETSERHEVIVFGPQAENCAQYLAKGRFVRVEGKMHFHAEQKELKVDGVKIKYQSKPIMVWEHSAVLQARRVTFFPRFAKSESEAGAIEVEADAEAEAEAEVELSNN